MHSQLIISRDIEFIKAEINKKKVQYQISPFSFIEINPEPSIGIAQVRSLKKSLTLMPAEGKYKLVVINDLQKATAEAQNALLKLFEEPSENTLIIATAPAGAKILPTIISRCRIISQTSIGEFKTEKNQSNELLSIILTSPPAERLMLAQELAKSKEDTLNLLGELLKTLSRILRDSSAENNLSLKETAGLISKIEAAQRYVESNVSYKGVMDLLLLGFPDK